MLLASTLVGMLALASPADRITPRLLAVPGVTGWRPVGCRSVPFSDPVLPPRTAFRRAHGDLEGDNEVTLAYAPVFERTWIAEPSIYQVTTPAFDGAGNLYMTPLLPHEPILLISLEPGTGARRFVVPLEPGDLGGGAAPMVLRDPDAGSEVVYVNAYDRVLAVRTDGTTVWSVPTGLGPVTTSDQGPIGLTWVPNADSIVALMRDGFVVLLDRRTGAPVLPAPFLLPGERTPPRPSTIPASLAATVGALLQPLAAFPSGFDVLDLINVLLGGDSKVANNLSVDGVNGRLWIASSARDGEDGHVDGVSELGAVYRYDVVPARSGWTLAEVCHHNFEGGSASTPTLAQNGTRIYLGDDAGALIAIDTNDCSEAWSVPLDSQIFGSIAAASDGRELYAASAGGIFQVFDDGASGRRGWTAALDLYDVPADLSGYGGMNLLLAGIGANGLLIQAGVGIRTGMQALPVRTGIVHVDRLTGAPRWFADGLEESLGAMSTGPDGALYLPHSPRRCGSRRSTRQIARSPTATWAPGSRAVSAGWPPRCGGRRHVRRPRRPRAISARRPMHSAARAASSRPGAAAISTAAAEQRQLPDRQSEDMAPDPLERHLRRQELHPVARAPELVTRGEGLSGSRQAEADRPDRFLGRPAVWPGDPGGGHRDVRSHRLPRAGGHLGSGLLAHRAVIRQRRRRDAQQPVLGVVGVRDDAAAHVGRAAGYVGEPVRHETARTRLRRCDGESPLGEQASHRLFERDGALAVAARADRGAQPVADDRQALARHRRLAVHHHAHRHLGKAGAERDPSLGRVDHPGNQLVETRFGHTEGLEGPRQVDVAAALRAQPRQHRLLHHRLHLAGHTGQHDEMAVAVRDTIAGRRAERVRYQHRTLRHERLLQVVQWHRATGGREPAPDAVCRLGVLDQRHAEHARHGLAGEVVGSRTDAARRDDHVRLLERLVPRPLKPVGIVPDRDDAGDVDADLEELVCDPARVRVDDPTRRELVAGGQDGRALDH
jgi:outer membrane protein assembly factor BamB